MDNPGSNHARAERARQGIEPSSLEQVLVSSSPQQVVPERDGILALQSVFDAPDGKSFLLRMLLNQKDTAVVATAYRTSKLAKYWRQS